MEGDNTPKSLCVMETYTDTHCIAFTTTVHSNQPKVSRKIRGEAKNPPKEEEDSEGEEALSGQNR